MDKRFDKLTAVGEQLASSSSKDSDRLAAIESKLDRILAHDMDLTADLADIKVDVVAIKADVVAIKGDVAAIKCELSGVSSALFAASVRT